MKRVPLHQVKDDLSRFLHEEEGEDIVITRPGKPAGLPLVLESENDRLDHRLESDPRFLERVAAARRSLGAGRGVPLEPLSD